jgi:hypothetical protein
MALGRVAANIEADQIDLISYEIEMRWPMVSELPCMRVRVFEFRALK